jgi:hypothetical protein
MESVMTDIHTAADRIAAILTDIGQPPHEITHSTNRYGQKSSYIDMGRFRFRVSDHPANENFRVAEVPMQANATRQDLIEFFARCEEAQQDRKSRESAWLIERERMEAPFKARFLAEKMSERQTAIIGECYPGVTNNKAITKEIRKRWLA